MFIFVIEIGKLAFCYPAQSAITDETNNKKIRQRLKKQTKKNIVFHLIEKLYKENMCTVMSLTFGIYEREGEGGRMKVPSTFNCNKCSIEQLFGLVFFGVTVFCVHARQYNSARLEIRTRSACSSYLFVFGKTYTKRVAC